MSCAVLARVVRNADTPPPVLALLAQCLLLFPNAPNCADEGFQPNRRAWLRTGCSRVKIALCACFPPNVHAAPGTGVPGLLCDVSKQHVAEGHSNATIRLSDDASPLSGSLN
jgi:hypothetical protein